MRHQNEYFKDIPALTELWPQVQEYFQPLGSEGVLPGAWQASALPLPAEDSCFGGNQIERRRTPSLSHLQAQECDVTEPF